MPAVVGNETHKHFLLHWKNGNVNCVHGSWLGESTCMISASFIVFHFAESIFCLVEIRAIWWSQDSLPLERGQLSKMAIDPGMVPSKSNIQN